ncbi:MAG: bifunctional pyr operon transcriptional regulator/uracil phosphoribosyltransferase PyrR [Candidatus Zixiibacteriota bacterium]
MTKQSGDLILDDKKMTRALTRIAHEIVEHNGGAESLVFIGIITRGAVLAKRIARLIKEMEGFSVPVGLMDISLYRDDVHSKLDQPVVQQTDILFSLVDKNVILIDDVLFTGRTIRAALDQINDFGRPRTIQLAVLVDRGHRELPIKADYVGVNVPTSKNDQIVVKVEEKDKLDSVSIICGAKETGKPATAKSPVRKDSARKKGGKK